MHAWEPPFEHVHGTETLEVLRVAALGQATELVDDALGKALGVQHGRDVHRMTGRPVRGEASEVLLGTVRPGDLLVVGANRGDVVRRLLLGVGVVEGGAVGPLPRRRRARRPPPDASAAGRPGTRPRPGSRPGAR